MKRLIFTLALAFTVAPSWAAPSLMSGNEFIELIPAYDKIGDRKAIPEEVFKATKLMGYAQGTADLGNGIFFCIPVGVTIAQIVTLTKREMDERPEKLHHAAALFISNALSKAFPCPTSSPPKK